MKANETPKSKFVYPDKLYARTNDNITLDISYAPQTMEAVEYTRTDAFVQKAAEWLKENADHYVGHYLNDGDTYIDESFIDEFKNYMKGE